MSARVLITNDDGVDCLFLHELVAAIGAKHRVTVVAPDGERSWIGRAFSRNGDVVVKPTTVPGATAAWSVSGTPSDCVNIALGHLMTGADAPAIVVSGINIGYNVSMPLGLSSGTMAGATEGAAWGLRAVALSLDLPPEAFEHLRHHDGRATGATLHALRCAAKRALAFVDTLLDAPAPVGKLEIHNFNFPHTCTDATPVERVAPAQLRLGSLFSEAAPGIFRFVWNDGVDHSADDRTDLATLARGAIAHTVVDYQKLGR